MVLVVGLAVETVSFLPGVAPVLLVPAMIVLLLGDGGAPAGGKNELNVVPFSYSQLCCSGPWKLGRPVAEAARFLPIALAVYMALSAALMSPRTSEVPSRTL